MKKKKNEQRSENKLYAIHLDGKQIDKYIWKEYSEKYGSSGLYSWKTPKRYYATLGHAKAGVSHLPKQIQNKVEIITYYPENSVNEVYERLFRFADLVERMISEGDNSAVDKVVSEIKKIHLSEISFIGQDQKPTKKVNKSD